MSRVDDVVYNFIYTRGCAGLEEDSKKLLSDAVRYGFQEGELQPENERGLKIEIEKLRKELEAEKRSHTYWREEYYKLLDKRGVE